MKRTKRIRKTVITKNEIVADFIFFLVPALISLILVFLFDIHQSFYAGENLFPPSKYIFGNPLPYLGGTFLGGVIGFFLIKVFLFGVHEEEETEGA